MVELIYCLCHSACVFAGKLSNFMWGPPMIVLLFGTHLFLTLRLRLIQQYLRLAIQLAFAKDEEGTGDVSQFGALMTALAATIGTGNIIGVGTAVALGGPGAVLWLWLTGVFGIATKYSEALLAIKYRVKTSDGTMLGGPMYALERGLGLKWLAVVFCVFTAIAAFGIGNMTQANAISVLVRDTLHVPQKITGLVCTVLTGLVILGGIKSIAKVCNVLVPTMAVVYIAGCVIILAMNCVYLPAAIKLIVTSAFSLHAVGGGAFGAMLMKAMRYGIARGLFSNESGLGSAPIVAAAARTRNPVRQALVSSTGTFWDTVVVCAMTGLVIVTSMVRAPRLVGVEGNLLTKSAFAQIPYVGPIALTIGMLTFVFSTLLGWSYYGERALEYLGGKRVIKPYRVLWVAAVMLGSVAKIEFVWDFADAANALMAWPNLVAVLLLNGVVVAETRKYLWEGRIDEVSPDIVPDHK